MKEVLNMKFVATAVVVSSFFCLHGQNFEKTQLIHELADRTAEYFEGYSSKVIQNSFNYHSFRHDVGASMITRCLETPSPMAWKTAVVPVEFNEPVAGFIWIAALDMTSTDATFSVWVNGEKRFTLKPSRQSNWEVEGDQGSKMAFQSLMRDRHGDAHGYMTLQMPMEWIALGEAQEIKIQGDNSNQSSWIIVYEAKDALSFLHESSDFDALYSLHAELKGMVYTVVTETANALSGNSIRLETGKFMRKDELIWSDGLARSEIRVPKQKMDQKITLYDDRGEILQWNFGLESKKNSILMAEGVLKNSLVSISDTAFNLIAERNYMPELVESILALAKSDMAKGHILLMNSSHQDIAWMDSPEKCMLERDTMLLQPLFNRAEIDKDYRFDVEDALMIKEYIHRHPDKKDLVRELFADGRISCGASFSQPYEEMYSGEALARQFYYGARWLKEEFGYTADTYWNVDVPGRSLQMPQLMKKAGVNNLVMTRQELGFYNWYSPDGSKITAFSNGHYGDSFGPLGDEYY
ncbi:MAG: hypothetical protein J7L96_03115, partial [Bacteroidales bacterium]|nr:hypothetical protein [Bacteroidales bacterium]